MAITIHIHALMANPYPGRKVLTPRSGGTGPTMREASETDAAETAKRTAGWLVWILVILVVVSGLVGLLLLGPFGLAVAIPVGIIAVILFGASSGAATGA